MIRFKNRIVQMDHADLRAEALEGASTPNRAHEEDSTLTHLRLAALAATAVLTLGSATAGSAANLVPISYGFDAATDCGTWCYHDAGGELIDGLVSPAGWALNAGAGWLGWRDPVINIDFSFGAAKTFESVSVGSTQDNPFDVVLPNLTIYSSLNGVDWTLRGNLVTPVSNANNVDPYSSAPHGFLTVGGLNFTAAFVRVRADSNGPFTFIDEVRFAGVNPGAIPEPSAWAMMLIGFGAAGSLIRRRRRSALA